MNKISYTLALLMIMLSFSAGIKGIVPISDSLRAEEISDMKFGMFICWSFSTFYGEEWTPTLDKDASYFKATGCDTDQWCQVAKDAGMGYILFLAKHHDGFCLWDTKTTDKKVTNSPIGIDVLEQLRKSCDKYGIKLALYFSEGDWNWPGAIDGQGYSQGMGINPAMKQAQLKELCTQYGPIEFFWMDHAVGDGGLNHRSTVEWIHQYQPDCFIGFNHGEPAGRLSLRELGKPGPVGDASATKYNKKAEANYKGYLVAEFTYPILPPHEGGAMWFYSLPKHDSLCHPPEKLYKDYRGALKYGNIFSIDVGPDYEGKIRDIDVETLRRVGELIKEEEIKSTLINMWDAIENEDIELYASYIHPDFTQFGESDPTLSIGKEAEVSGTREWIKNSKNIHTEMEGPLIVIKDSVAWITYYWKDRGTTNGEAFSSRGKSTRIFVKENGRWLCIHGHYTLLP